MIWFFLAGFIAGVVGTVMLIGYWAKTHSVKMTKEEFIQEVNKMEEDKTDD